MVQQTIAKIQTMQQQGQTLYLLLHISTGRSRLVFLLKCKHKMSPVIAPERVELLQVAFLFAP